MTLTSSTWAMTASQLSEFERCKQTTSTKKLQKIENQARQMKVSLNQELIELKSNGSDAFDAVTGSLNLMLATGAHLRAKKVELATYKLRTNSEEIDKSAKKLLIKLCQNSWDVVSYIQGRL